MAILPYATVGGSRASANPRTFQTLNSTRGPISISLVFMPISIPRSPPLNSVFCAHKFPRSSFHPFPSNFTNCDARPYLCRATGSSPPPPRREPEPPPGSGLTRFTGLARTLSRFRDRFRIFSAVFFWMSLFFWASAWDGRSKGRPNKGSRNKR